MDSKEYSWAWVTASRLLSHGACELLYALLDPATAADYATIYDGESTSGDALVILRSLVLTTPQAFSPKEPVYCRRGLYVAVAGTAKVFVQWRDLGHKEGG